jgi:pimeloyl-ACP methyl ester carboxylesterase
MPILLLWGQSERLLPRSSLAYFRHHLPRHAVIEEPVGFGHCPHLDDAARLAERLVEFAASAVAS